MQKSTKTSKIRLFAAMLFAFVLLTAATLSVGAFGYEDNYFYVNSETGDDHADGYSADTAVKTFTQACRYAVSSGAEKAYIVFTNEYSIPSTVKELSHPNTEFVITTKDATTDYAETNGAKIVYGSGLRWYLNGDTTFDNLLFTYTKSIVFVAQYNHITFGENFVNTRIDDANNVIYIVGGYQSPLDDCINNLDSHITIKGGDFDYVIGGSRQKGTGASGITFTGTHYLEVEGGTIEKLFGASYANQINTAAVINISGGDIGAFYVAGDATRRFEQDATVTITGGKIGEMHVNNVVGAATVYLLGGSVGSMDVTFGSTEIATMERKANKDDTLYYDAHYYTKEQIAAFSDGFEVVENVSKIYVKDGGTGAGTSESDATSYENAIKLAAESDSVIVIAGLVTLNNFVEPAHENEIVIEGLTSTSTLKIEGTYTFSGKTSFRNMRLSGTATLDASNGAVAIENTVGNYHTYNIVGSAELYTGTYASVTAAGNVYVDGATVTSITGGTDTLSVEVVSGTVGTIKTTDTSVKNANISISGGTVDKVVFNNVTSSLSYLLYGGTVKAYEVSGTNVTGALKMGEGYTTDALGAAAAIFEVDNTVVYYLKDGGTGNGTSVTAAGGSLPDAFAAIGNNDGVIVVCGSYDIPVYSSTGSGFVVPEHTGEILITSVYDGVDYRKTSGACVNILQNIYLGGDIKIDGLDLVCKKSYGGILAAYHNLYIGADVNCYYGGSVTTYPSVVGGTYLAVENVSGSVTINGGTWQRVRLGNSTGVPVNASLDMTINGGTFLEKIAISTTSTHSGGDLSLTVNGGTFNAGIVGASMTSDDYSCTANMSVTLNGGTVYGKVVPTDTKYGTFHGTWSVTLSGGDFAHISDIKGTADVNGDMTSTLYVSENLDINEELTGTYSFTSLVRNSPNGADPWLFYHDGFYYYIATAAGNGLQLVKAANLGDLANATSTQIYKPEKGHEWSAHLWSPEIHYFSPEEIGEEYAGWYCFLGSQPDDAWHAANGEVDDPAGFGEQRAYVIKCLTDDLTGPWGNPITGEANVPQKIQFPDSDFNVNELTGGCSVITINGTKYITFISEVGRETSGTSNFNFYQTINIAKFTNPWTIEGQPQVICKPDYDWEKGGSEDGIHPQVVEGSTAVYGPNGEVYIIYSGSGYWTAKYQLGQLTYIGGPNGDPTDINNWSKKPTSIFSQSAELTGCGHASYVTDTDGQGWICYHAYPKGDKSRRAYVEPYYFTDEGVVIGDGSGHPAKMDTVYTANLNPLPVAERVSDFDKTETVKATFAFARDYDGRFTDVTTSHWFYSYVENAYELKLANGTSDTKFSPDNTFTVAQALTAAVNIHSIYNGKTVRATASGEAWYAPYVEYCVENGIITEGQFTNMDANITRGDMAIVFANILPEEEYADIRSGSNPDVTSDMACYEAVAKLYKAGIVGGDSGTGNYRPGDSIKRSEACVIFTRIAMKSARAN
ncbi:MAG: S-layer homology domain-containing protein [Clostridia bacterium]|nr:S-layer homology domain-containing protein [Clostridia bacterium]